MTTNTVTADQRTYERYRPQKDAFVIINDEPLQLGRIINISRSGLAFCCVDNGKPIINSCKLDIFLAGDWFHLAEIPYKIVSEFYLSRNISDDSIKLRQCCVVYGHLTHFQNSALDYFIRKYTVANP